MFYLFNRHYRQLAAGIATILCMLAPEARGEDPAGLDNSRWQEIAVVETSDSEKDAKNIEFTSEPQKDDDDTDIPGDPHRGNKTWLLPDPQTQLLRDKKLQTVTTGGIFVPAMSPGMNEPRYQIRNKSNEVIYEGQTGTTAYVSQGDYTVTVGSVVSGERPEFDVHVAEGAITTVPVEWSGLIVKVVNDRSMTIRSNYEIVSLPDRAYVGLGTGALVNEGEQLSTWLLWPGRYMIISAGEGYQARKNFITVKLEPGELSRVTLVLDEDTGNVLGGGEIDSEIDALEERWWWASVLLGGSVRFNRTDNVVGKVTGQLLDVSAFVDSSFTLGREKHYFYARLNAEIGGTIRFEERPFITTIDELNLDLLYTYRFVDWFGPYVRFSFESNMAPSWQELNGNYTVEKYKSDGSDPENLLDQTEIKLAPSFSPLKLNAGAGGRFDYSIGTWFKLAARLGLAYRYVYTHDLFVPAINDDEKLVTLIPVDSSSQFGMEAAATLDLTPIKWFTLKVDAQLLEPFDNMKEPIVDLDVDAAFRLSSIASLSYTLRLNYDTSLIDKVQIDQFIQLRFSYKVY
ncbi:MAG: hypothetical protein IJU23_04250 [Proteobacteria bacterium]|nr:hypothetical protein [Pseudomonadota bacterium]